MSYILDALKRADAERERGQVPGLHSQASAPLPSASPRRTATGRPARALLGLCLLALVGAGLWWWTQHAAEPSARVQPVPAPEPVALPSPAVAQPTDRAPAALAVARTPVPPILIPAPAPASTPARVPPPATPSAATTTPPPATLPAAPAGALRAKALQAPADDADAGVRRFADLSPEQRAQLPTLNVNGASYSANPAHRMLIVNGAVVHEGQEVAPGLTLERIGLHQAVLRHGSLRYSVGY